MFCMICGGEEETLALPTLEQVTPLVTNNTGNPFELTDFKIVGYVLQVCSDTCWNNFKSVSFKGVENIGRDLKVDGNAGLSPSEKLIWTEIGLRCSSCGLVIGNICEGHQ